MIAKSDLVFTTSDVLYSTISQTHNSVYLIQNGVDVNIFQCSYPLPEDMEDIQKPIIGFSGSLDPRWVDVKLLKLLIENNPQWSFVFIGNKTNLLSCENLHLLGMKSYDKVPAYITHFDVTLIPFLDNRVARGSNPVKMYEYLAAGKPIVSRRLPEIEKVGGIYRYTNVSGAEEAIEKALVGGGEKVDLYLKTAEEHSWEKRFRDMYQVILAKMREKGW